MSQSKPTVIAMRHLLSAVKWAGILLLMGLMLNLDLVPVRLAF
jgi:hypothetical protein